MLMNRQLFFACLLVVLALLAIGSTFYNTIRRKDTYLPGNGFLILVVMTMLLMWYLDGF